MTKLEVASFGVDQSSCIVNDKSGRFEAWFFWAIWLSTWFSPFKLNIGLNISIEFALAYLLVLYYLMTGGFTNGQVVGVLGLGLIAILDYVRTQDIKVFMFLGFVIVNFSMVEFARRLVPSSSRFGNLFLLIPMLAVLIRFLIPESGAIVGYDEATVDGVSVQRFNLLGYESNSLAAMMSMLLGAVLAGIGQLKLMWRVTYSFFCIAVIALTLSRTGIFTVILLLIFFTFQSRAGARVTMVLLSCMLLAALLLPDLNPMLEAISHRASGLNYFQDERGSILMERLVELQQSSTVFLFGCGFMSAGASDNSFLTLLYGYGYFGALVALIGMLLILGIGPNKIKWQPQLVGIFIGLFFFLLTLDIFGQAKIIGCFYCLVGLSGTVQVKHMPIKARESLK